MTTRLSNLPDVVFVDASAEKVEQEIIKGYEAAAGRTLAKGDPVRLFLLTVANEIALLKNAINYTGKQNLLRYAEGGNLDHLGALVGVNRTPATAATTTMQVTLSTALGINVLVPEGTRFTAGDNVFFALDDPLIITAGNTTGTGRATCQEVGIVGNDYTPGTINTLVDPVPYVTEVENITISEGGAAVEEDEKFREDIQAAPETFTTAGPDAAYEYRAKRAATAITDVAVWSPLPGVVEVRPLMQGGELPGDEILEIVSEALNDRTVRPLTDKVNVLKPTVINYNISLTYYINKDDKNQAAEITAAVYAAVDDYIVWQKSKLGRDIIPDELTRRIMEAGAKRVVISSPVFTEVELTQVALAEIIAINLGGLENA